MLYLPTKKAMEEMGKWLNLSRGDLVKLTNTSSDGHNYPLLEDYLGQFGEVTVASELNYGVKFKDGRVLIIPKDCVELI